MNYGVDVIDIEGTLARLGGDHELLGELVELFLEEAPRLLDAARQAVQAGDADALRREGHALKGAAGAIGAVECERLAFDLERMGCESELAAAPAGLARLEEHFRKLTEALEEIARG